MGAAAIACTPGRDRESGTGAGFIAHCTEARAPREGWKRIAWSGAEERPDRVIAAPCASISQRAVRRRSFAALISLSRLSLSREREVTDGAHGACGWRRSANTAIHADGSDRRELESRETRHTRYPQVDPQVQGRSTERPRRTVRTSTYIIINSSVMRACGRRLLLQNNTARTYTGSCPSKG